MTRTKPTLQNLLLAITVDVVLTIGAVRLIAFSGSNDGYFTPEPTTYWEFGGTGGRPAVIASIILTAAVVVGLLIVVGVQRRRLHPAVMLGLAAITVLGQFVASIALRIGH